jgi:hypothetical protein
MIALLCFLLTLLASPFKSKSRLEAENVVLRRQLIILRRKVCGRVHLSNGDRLFFVQLYRWFPSVLNTITIIRPETVVRWHRAGFRRYWRWKSSRSDGRRPRRARGPSPCCRALVHGERCRSGGRSGWMRVSAPVGDRRRARSHQSGRPPILRPRQASACLRAAPAKKLHSLFRPASTVKAAPIGRALVTVLFPGIEIAGG